MTTPIVLANDDVAYAAAVTAKRAKVRRMQVVASTLLLAMLTVFALCAAFEPVYPALRWVQAFAEAAAVGARCMVRLEGPPGVRP